MSALQPGDWVVVLRAPSSLELEGQVVQVVGIRWIRDPESGYVAVPRAKGWERGGYEQNDAQRWLPGWHGRGWWLAPDHVRLLTPEELAAHRLTQLVAGGL